MQIYRRMDIGTAKPTPEERQGVAHHMLDVAEPDENFSVARYVELASRAVDDILRRGKVPVIAGGTGLYLDSLLSGRTFAPYPSTGWRERLQKRGAEEGMERLLEELRAVDPEAAGRLHLKDEKRIIRALEVWHETGRTITQHNLDTQALPPRYEGCWIGLNFADRAQLWERIDRRVDQMLEQGLVEEIRRLLAEGIDPGATAMQAIGYKEMAEAVRTGGDLAAAADEVRLRSRQYAKRQLTWFRKNPAIHWYHWQQQPDFAAACQFATEIIRASGIG